MNVELWVKFIAGVAGGTIFAMSILYFRERSYRKALKEHEESCRKHGDLYFLDKDKDIPNPKSYFGRSIFNMVCLIINKLRI